jgi:hypothetical protein
MGVQRGTSPGGNWHGGGNWNGGGSRGAGNWHGSGNWHDSGNWHGGGDWHGGHGHGWHGHGGSSVYFGLSPWWWGGWYPYSYGYAYPYYYPSYAYPAYPDAAYSDEDQVYGEREPDTQPRAEGYWYYCESKRGYYPRIAQCPEEWVRVPATPE